VKLNLGCSDDLKPGYLNVDIALGKEQDPVRFPYQQADLNQSWPWEDSSVDEIFAWDVAEHLDSQIHFFNEAHRCLRAGGLLDLAVPCVHLLDGRCNPGAWADPTHKQFFTLDTRYYYGEQWNDPANERGRFGEAYGITALFRGDWTLRDYGEGAERRSKIFAKLTAVK